MAMNIVLSSERFLVRHLTMMRTRGCSDLADGLQAGPPSRVDAPGFERLVLVLTRR
jgi:hypothetical protein